MNSKSTLIRNTLLNIASYAYNIIIAIIYIPILLGNVSTHTFGLYAVFASIPQLISSLDLGLTSSTIRHLATSSGESRSRYWQASFSLFTQIGIFLGTATALILTLLKNSQIFSTIPSSDITIISLTLGCTVLLDYLIMHLITLSQADQRFEIYNIRTILVGSNGLVAALVSLYTHSLAAIFLWRLTTLLVTFLILYLDSIKHLDYPKNFGSHTKEKTDLLNFGLKNFVGKAINQLQAQYPKYLLLNYISPAAVAIYSIPLTLVQRAAGFINQLSLAFFPFAANLSTSKRGKLRLAYISLQLLIAILAVGQIFVVKYFARPILLWWLKDPVIVDSVMPVLSILSYSLSLIMLTPLPSALFDGLGHPQITSFFATITTALEIIIALIYVRGLGVLAPAYASFIALLLTTPFLLITSLKFFDGRDRVK